MRWVTLIFCLLLTISSSWGRTFVSADGKTAISATLLDYDPDKEMVKIRRHDGKVFTNALSMYSRSDQAFVLRWNDGKRENYAFYGRQYPGHLKLFLKLLEEGNVGYGQTILYGPTQPPIILGNGSTPFLAFVNGYDMLAARNQRADVTGITFNLNKKNWQARIALQSMRSTVASVGAPIMVGGNLATIQSVSGPILYQRPSNIVIVNPPAFGAPVIMMPRQPAPVFVNPYRGGFMMNGVTMGGGGVIGSSSSFSRGGGLSIRISK